MKIAVSIGGSDSGGGAGIQADLKTFMSLNVHGCSVITCITAQNSVNVIDVEPVKTTLLNSQFDALFTDFKVNAIKTGMLFNEQIIKEIASKLIIHRIPKIIDPVMCTRTGARLLEEDSVYAYKKFLFPQAELLTPNIFEAELLSNIEIETEEDFQKAGQKILQYGCNSVLIKGGGLRKFKGKDYFISQDGLKSWLNNQYVETLNTHGSGCTLSAAICSYRALGVELIESIKLAKSFIERSLKKSYKIGSGPGPLGHY